LADSLGAYVYGVLAGEGVTQMASAMYHAGADGVRVADHPLLQPFSLEPHFRVLSDLFKVEQPEVVIFGATAMAAELAPRLAQALHGGLIEHVTSAKLDEATRTVHASYPVYGGEYYEIAACPDARPQFLTVEPGAFSAPYLDLHRQGEATLLQVEPVPGLLSVVGPAEGFEPPHPPLSKAKVIVAAGRQAGEFQLVQQLAEALGGRVAGDSGARDAGWIGPQQMVDVRGVTVTPDVYVAVGIGGDTFHNAAVQASFLVAIHPDDGAPIFGIADLCLVADPREILPLLLDEIKGS
jgi:electron transfer flavoprotein alpha subunit